jgi:hypothetical protein
MIRLRIICVLQYAESIKFRIYLNLRPVGSSTFQLGKQNEGNCLAFIIRHRIIHILQYALCNMHIILCLVMTYESSWVLFIVVNLAGKRPVASA